MADVRTVGLLSGHAIDQIPPTHHDLIECPPVVAFTTVMRDGYPQTSVVWCDFDGGVRARQHDARLRQGAEHAP